MVTHTESKGRKEAEKEEEGGEKEEEGGEKEEEANRKKERGGREACQPRPRLHALFSTTT